MGCLSNSRFSKIFNDNYIEFLKNIFLTLIKNNGKLPEKWLEDRILRLENYSGGIEELIYQNC